MKFAVGLKDPPSFISERRGTLSGIPLDDMVKAFDDVVFKGPLLKVQGPVKTRFGWHLIETIYRN